MVPRIPTLPEGWVGGIASPHALPTASSPPSHKHPPSVHTRAWLCVVACDTGSHVYPCKSSVLSRHLLALQRCSPLWSHCLSSSSSSLFVFLFICSSERRLGSVETYPFFCPACQLFFPPKNIFIYLFINGFFRVSCRKGSLSLDTRVVLKNVRKRWTLKRCPFWII